MATLYESYTTNDDWLSTPYGSNVWRAQTFTPSTAHTITSVKLLLCREGSPGTLTVCIKATDGSGHPTGADLCSGTTDGDTLPTGSPYEWREITLGDGAELAASTKYAIILKALSGDTSNYPMWRNDDTSPSYTGGNYEYTNDGGTNWTANTGRDSMFEDWGDPLGVDVTIDVPLATVTGTASVPTLYRDMIPTIPLATVTSEGKEPSLALDKILSIPLVGIDSQALVPEITAGYGVIISVPLALVNSEGKIPTLELDVVITIPLSAITSQAYAARITYGRTLLALRNLEAIRELPSVRDRSPV